ncbi:MAG: folate-binding protein YgfZ [Acidobacteria bacterium]|jgi:folate-binding protein YgfZ|nr:folate-binding protein YgfZ [Acidobacteriota bacterium]
MNTNLLNEYNVVRENAIGFYERKRGLIEISGKEAVQFLNGLITNDAAKLEENQQMLAAFPNAQGRLLAVVRVLRLGDKFLFETEAETYEKILKNLQRFTFAGDFFVEDLSSDFRYFEITDSKFQISNHDFITFQNNFGVNVFVPQTSVEDFLSELKNKNAVEISDELYEILRIENGIPKYGVDADETTIVPELGIEGLISYNKGCYIGQEIIARIHFRGHIAKQLTGLILSEPSAAINGFRAELQNAEIKSLDGKNAGKITSVTFSPKLEKFIALAFVRYDYLAEGTELKVSDATATVKNLPFIKRIS